MEQKQIRKPSFLRFNFSVFYYAAVHKDGTRGANNDTRLLLTGKLKKIPGGVSTQGTGFVSGKLSIPDKYIPPFTYDTKASNGIRTATEEELKDRLQDFLPPLDDLRIPALTAAKRVNFARKLPTIPLTDEENAQLEAKFQAIENAVGLGDTGTIESCALSYLAAALKIAVKYSGKAYNQGKEGKRYDSVAKKVIESLDAEKLCAYLDQKTSASLPSRKQFSPIDCSDLPDIGAEQWKGEPKPAMEIFFAGCGDPEENFPAYVSPCEGDQAAIPLNEALDKTKNSHLFLLGQGGAGKTTALRDIAEQVYRGDKTFPLKSITPFYLDLSSAPDVEGPFYTGGRSSFIRRSLYRILGGEDSLSVQPTDGKFSPAFTVDENIIREYLNPVLTQRNSSGPAILLLLDGVNEMSRRVPPGADAPVAVMVQREIAEITKICPNVRIVLAGRVDDGILGSENILRYDLCELTDEIICDHLSAAKLPSERVDAIMSNPPLLAILRLPLFLSIFVHLKDTGEASTQGELLHIFFGERKTDSPIYTTRGRNRQIEENLEKSSPNREGRLTAELMSFIIDFLLPEIAWQMEDRIWIHGEGIGQAIDRILDDQSETAVRSWIGAEVFSQYRDPYNPEKHTDRTAQLLEMLGSSRRNLTDKVLAYCRFNLGILEHDRGSYRFSHQIFRDYFAAVKVINTFRIAAETYKIARTLRGAEKAGKEQAAFACLNGVLGGAPLDSTVRRLVGEILGEHRNLPYPEKDNWVLPRHPDDHSAGLCRQMLDICRGQQGNEADYTVFNLVQIMRESRGGDLSGLDFSALDLRRCALNGARLARPGLAARFAEAKLSRDTLFPTGHTSIINTIAYHPDPAAHMLITASSDRTAKIWDTRTGVCMGTLRGHRFHVASAAFHPCDPHYALTASYDGTAKIWDIRTLECVQTLDDDDDPLLCAAYRPDGTMIATTSGMTVKLWEMDSQGKYVCTDPLDKHPALAHLVLFHPKENSFLTQYGQAGLRVWHQTGKTWAHTDIDCHQLGLMGNIISAVYHPEGERILVSAGHPTCCIELDAHSLNPLREPWQGAESGLSDLVYSADGKKLISADGDLIVYDTERLDELLRVSLRPKFRFFLCSLAISPDGTHIALGSHDTSVEIRDITTGERCAVMEGFQKQAISANYHPAGDRLVIIGNDGTASLWSSQDSGNNDSPGFRHLTSLFGEYPICLAEFHPDPQIDQLLTVSECGTVSLWNTASEARTDTFRELALRHAAYSRNGKYILLSSEFYMGFALWDPNAEVLVHSSFPVCFSAGSQLSARDEEGLETSVGRYLTVSSDRKTVTLWQLHLDDSDQSQILLPQTVLAELASDDHFLSADISPDCSLILTAQKKGTLNLYDPHTGKLRCTETPDEPISAACFNCDGTRAAVCGNGTIHLWEVQGDKLIPTEIPPFESKALINSVTFSPDGKHILTALNDGTCRILDAETLECRHIIPHITGLFVRGVDLSRAIAPDLTQEDRDTLRLYGANFD